MRRGPPRASSSTGDQPAQALPAGTIGYVSVDLDPSGEQKIEAIRTLRKFPAFADNVDLDTDDDLRERLFTELTESGECEGLDYAADVEPWLGDRAAVAAVDTGAESPSPVLVVQVTDAGGAEDGLATLQETCGGDEVDSATAAWTVEGDWAVIGETVEITDQVVADAGDGLAGRRLRLPALDRGRGRPRHREHVRRPGRRAVPRRPDGRAGLDARLDERHGGDRPRRGPTSSPRRWSSPSPTSVVPPPPSASTTGPSRSRPPPTRASP